MANSRIVIVVILRRFFVEQLALLVKSPKILTFEKGTDFDIKLLLGFADCKITTGGWRYTSTLSTTTESSGDDCSNACYGTTNCMYWSYITSSNQCNLISHASLDFNQSPEPGPLIRGTKYCNAVTATTPTPTTSSGCSTGIDNGQSL